MLLPQNQHSPCWWDGFATRVACKSCRMPTQTPHTSHVPFEGETQAPAPFRCNILFFAVGRQDGVASPPVLQEALQRCRSQSARCRSIQRREALSTSCRKESLRPSKTFPSLLLHLIALGRSTGTPCCCAETRSPRFHSRSAALQWKEGSGSRQTVRSRAVSAMEDSTSLTCHYSPMQFCALWFCLAVSAHQPKPYLRVLENLFSHLDLFAHLSALLLHFVSMLPSFPFCSC